MLAGAAGRSSLDPDQMSPACTAAMKAVHASAVNASVRYRD
jgi:hypothetical protein